MTTLPAGWTTSGSQGDENVGDDVDAKEENVEWNDDDDDDDNYVYNDVDIVDDDDIVDNDDEDNKDDDEYYRYYVYADADKMFELMITVIIMASLHNNDDNEFYEAGLMIKLL